MRDRKKEGRFRKRSIDKFKYRNRNDKKERRRIGKRFDERRPKFRRGDKYNDKRKRLFRKKRLSSEEIQEKKERRSILISKK